MQPSVSDFRFIQDLVRGEAAIELDDGKAYLAATRLGPVIKREGLGSFSELVDRLRSPRQTGLQQRVVEAMTTNETSFFRDVHPFEALRQVILPGLIERRASERRLAIWCAACSTGQEPYSIALLLREYFPNLSSWTITIVATDYSNEVLDRAREGVYRQLEVNRGVPTPLLVKYFKQEGLDWRLKPVIRDMVVFRQINLKEELPCLPPLDIVMIRNVLIYFDDNTKTDILQRISHCLRRDGYLFLGGSEMILRLDPGQLYESVNIGQARVFRRRGLF